MLSCIVEGHGERHALPVLARRVGESLQPPAYWDVPPAIRVPRSKLLRQGELERSVRLARANVVNSKDGVGAVLVVVDADDDCAALLGPELLRRAVSAAGEVPGRTYSETADQPGLVALMDLDAARSADSFDKLWRVLQELRTALL